jgi:hypothetical protein
VGIGVPDSDSAGDERLLCVARGGARTLTETWNGICKEAREGPFDGVETGP